MISGVSVPRSAIAMAAATISGPRYDGCSTSTSHGDSISGVPTQPARQPSGHRFDRRATVRRIEDQRTQVGSRRPPARAGAPRSPGRAGRRIRMPPRAARAPCGRTCRNRSVRTRCRGSRTSLGRRPPTRPRSTPNRTGANRRTGRAGSSSDPYFGRTARVEIDAVVRAAEHPRLPVPAIATDVGGQPAVARARLELRSIDAVGDDCLDRRHPSTIRSGWKCSVTGVDRSSGSPGGERCDMVDRPSHRILHRTHSPMMAAGPAPDSAASKRNRDRQDRRGTMAG